MVSLGWGDRTLGLWGGGMMGSCGALVLQGSATRKQMHIVKWQTTLLYLYIHISKKIGIHFMQLHLKLCLAQKQDKDLNEKKSI